MCDWTQDLNLRSVHLAVPRHRLILRLVIPNITGPFKVIAVQLGNSISRLRPITKGTSITFTQNVGTQRQRRSTRYTFSCVFTIAYNLTVHLTDCAKAKEKYVASESQTTATWNSLDLPMPDCNLSQFVYLVAINLF